MERRILLLREQHDLWASLQAKICVETAHRASGQYGTRDRFVVQLRVSRTDVSAGG